MEVGLVDSAGFEGEGEGIWVGWDADGGDFEELLFEVFSTEGGLGGAFLRTDRCEADGDGFEESAVVKFEGEAGDGVRVDGEFDALKEGEAAAWDRRPYLADLGDQGAAESVEDVAVLVGVLEDWVAEVGVEFPAGGADDFVVAVEGFVGGDEVETRGETRIARIFTDGWRSGRWWRRGGDGDGETADDLVHGDGVISAVYAASDYLVDSLG